MRLQEFANHQKIFKISLLYDLQSDMLSFRRQVLLSPDFLTRQLQGFIQVNHLPIGSVEDERVTKAYLLSEASIVTF